MVDISKDFHGFFIVFELGDLEYDEESGKIDKEVQVTEDSKKKDNNVKGL